MMKKLLFIPMIIFIAPITAMHKPVKPSKPSFMTVETPRAIFKISVSEKTTALQVKQQIEQLQGTSKTEQSVKRRYTWFGFKSSELKNHDKVLKKNSNPKRFSLCITPKKK